MDKTEALAERARLQQLLDGYDAGRLTHQDLNQRGKLTRDMPPIELVTSAPE